MSSRFRGLGVGVRFLTNLLPCAGAHAHARRLRAVPTLRDASSAVETETEETVEPLQPTPVVRRSATVPLGLPVPRRPRCPGAHTAHPSL